MNVYLLIEEKEQEGFEDNYGESAYPTSEVVGVYDTRKKAEKEKLNFERIDKENADKLDCDVSTYIIEERPLL